MVFAVPSLYQEETLSSHLRLKRFQLGKKFPAVIALVSCFSNAKWKTLIQVEDINVKEKVKSYIGQAIWARRVAFDVDSDEYMWHDVVGKKVVDNSGKELGTIISIDNYGAADIVVIEAEKDFYLYPLCLLTLT